ncbi:MAG: hypothetical protein RMI91_09180 [Gemmatales bacterium]|nr:hypothetical protein [Gemmatales bacterium]MDW7994812.1 hypothetical protein [Gemmatales bacterium]
MVSPSRSPNPIYTWAVRLDVGELSSDRLTAIQRAEQQAQTQVTSWLRQIWPNISWSPTTDQLRQLGILYDSYAETRELELPDGRQTMFVGVAECQLTADRWYALLRQAQLTERTNRLRWLSVYFLFPLGLLSALAYALSRPE